MYTYRQSTGELFDKDMNLLTKGYAGHGDGKNNPDMEGWANIGPLPCGLYSIGLPLDKPTTGQFSLPLIPREPYAMYGRSSFYMHGEDANNPGNASTGCPVIERKIRELINSGTDKLLNVIR